jgi:acetyltransferase-like isoleucine patch superfamily enzyme
MSSEEGRALRAAIGRAFARTYGLGVRARAKAFSLAVGGAFAEFGSRSVIQPPVRLKGEARISIGSDVFVGAGSWLQTLDGDGFAGELRVGDGTSIAGTCVLSAACSVTLGRKVLLARNVYVSDHIHRYDDPLAAILDQGLARLEPVEICDGAWLGQNVVVCPGVRIGRGAVVGANAVVTTDVPDRALAVGAPARVVRMLDEEPASTIAR